MKESAKAPHEAEHAASPKAFEQLQSKIHTVRGQQVMLDEDLAELYGVKTLRLNEQVKRNPGRFPSNFCFQLVAEEMEILRSQIAILRFEAESEVLRSQNAILEPVAGSSKVPIWHLKRSPPCLVKRDTGTLPRNRMFFSKTYTPESMCFAGNTSCSIRI